MEYCWGLINTLEGGLAEVLGDLLPEIKPSAYSGVFPNKLANGQGIAYIDQQAASGSFPTLISLAPALVYALILGVIRMLLHHLFLKRLALWVFRIENEEVVGEPVIEKELNLKACNYRPSEAAVKLFCSTKSKGSVSSNSSASKGNVVDLGSAVEVNTYIWRKRRKAIQNRKIVKFVEAVWRFIFYLVFEIVGYYTLVKPELAPWLVDTTQHWEHWPLHELSSAIKFYYQVELGCYIHQLMWTEVSRSDAMEMMIHHITAILLISLSYLTNYTRVGTSILFLHDAADIFLESAKIFNYTSKAPGRAWAKTLTDVFFATFAVIFFITRLIIYPRFIVSSVLFEAPLFFGTDWIGFWIFAGLLIILQCLHVFWFYLIGRMIYRLVTTGIDKDERSDDEDEGEDPSGGSIDGGKGKGKRADTKKNK